MSREKIAISVNMSSVAVDSSVLVAYFAQDEGADLHVLEVCVASGKAMLPPVVVTELLSDIRLPVQFSRLVQSIPQLALIDGFWVRAGYLRAKVLAKGLKANSADALIAQSCIDHDMPLLTRDRDFRHFVRVGGLKLY